MLPPFVDLEALADRLGIVLDVHEAEGLRAFRALEDASTLIRSEAGMDWVDDHDALEDVPDIIETITLAVAMRGFKNPDGFTQASTGDVSVSYSRDGGAASIFLTRAERRAVRKAGGQSSINSIPIESTYLDGADPRYVPVLGGGDPIPLGPWPWEVV